MLDVVVEIKNGRVSRVEAANSEDTIRVVYVDENDYVKESKDYFWPNIQPNKYEKIICEEE